MLNVLHLKKTFSHHSMEKKYITVVDASAFFHQSLVYSRSKSKWGTARLRRRWPSKWLRSSRRKKKERWECGPPRTRSSPSANGFVQQRKPKKCTNGKRSQSKKKLPITKRSWWGTTTLARYNARCKRRSRQFRGCQVILETNQQMAKAMRELADSDKEWKDHDNFTITVLFRPVRTTVLKTLANLR